MQNNSFSSVTHRFANLGRASVQIVRLQFPPVQQVLDAIKTVFRTLDFSDEFQAELGWLLFKLRCSVCFGLVQYSHEKLGLLAQVEEISGMVQSLPGSRESASLLIQHVSGLVQQTKNPKLEWILSNPCSAEDPKAVFGLMAMRKCFGADLMPQLQGAESARLEIISSLDQLASDESSTLILPGSLKYLSQGLFMKLFHEGRYSRFHVLLYQTEPLSFRRRRYLPESALFPCLSQGIDPVIENTEGIETAGDAQSEDEDLSRLLVSSTEDQVEGCSRKIIVFEDGMTIRVANSERVRVWRPESQEMLLVVSPAQMIEGDFVILEKSHRHALLNFPSGEQDLSTGLDATEIWRQPLQAMLLDHTPVQIARLMMATDHLLDDNSLVTTLGAHGAKDENAWPQVADESCGMVTNLATNISNWDSGRVYGPGDLPHMSALIRVLADEGYLKNFERMPEEAAQSWYRDLEKLRAGQQAAGVSLSAQIDGLLKQRLRKQQQPEGCLEITLENGMALTLRRLVMIAD